MNERQVTIEDMDLAIDLMLMAAGDPREPERYREWYTELATKFIDLKARMVHRLTTATCGCAPDLHDVWLGPMRVHRDPACLVNQVAEGVADTMRQDQKGDPGT